MAKLGKGDVAAALVRTSGGDGNQAYNDSHSIGLLLCFQIFFFASAKLQYMLQADSICFTFHIHYIGLLHMLFCQCKVKVYVAS